MNSVKNILLRLGWSFVHGSSHAAIGSMALILGHKANESVPDMNLVGFGFLLLTSGGYNFAKQLFRESNTRLKELGVTEENENGQ